ncbi:hypothetical protein FYZ48_08655 [Gimesia chilikensis]|uniref:hypothetical protein n=1 Tax=Gimesia chilikensis TaxID=2605989 RepID=UPI0011EFBDD5|nr:hypothetical protein [Gimesia chilikensis]KAA0139985.1 hypothetical protein FYZ48_08655 [Gimesia chilikensis]
MQSPAFDPQQAHRHFAATCFNKTWDYLDKADRTAAENLAMISACHASHWHWAQYEEHTPENISIAYWQLARVYAVTNQPSNAFSYAMLCLKVTQDNHLKPFCLAYAYEALARAASVANKPEEVETYKQQAKNIAETDLEGDEKQQLLDDLNTI